ncbi:MAG: hypothetical protein DHS20C15_16240 [Planctomycetota bacterium]|nr:MAG: hypothetical protein DHS20C15_16240 [Planctomycetota bacterium]
MSALVLSCLALFACGDETGSRAGQEPWPLTVQTDGVLGYLAVQLPNTTHSAFDEALGVKLDGLALDRHLLALHLDARVFGGVLGLALPLSDAGAFRRSFERSPAITSLGGDQFRLQLPAEHPLAQLVLVAKVSLGAATGGAQVSSLQQLGSLFNGAGLDLPLRLKTENGRALLAPSLEGVVVTRRVLDELDGMQSGAGPALVATLNVERLADTYYAELQQVLANLRSALLGAKLAGLGGMLSGALNEAARGGRSPLGELPVPPAAVWAFLELLGPQRVEALGLRCESLDVDVGDGADTDTELADVSAARASVLDALDAVDMEFTMRYAANAPERQVLQAFRPAPSLPGDSFVAFADPTLAADALANWLRPLAVLAHGDGTTASAWQQEFVSLCAPWDGRVIARRLPDGELALFLGTYASAEWDLPATEAWLRPLADALELELPERAAWDAAGQGTRAGNFTVISNAVAQVDALALELDAADWSGEDASQPCVRASFDFALTDDASSRVQLWLSHDTDTGDVRLRFAPTAVR